MQRNPLNQSQLEELIKKRRNEQDLDLEAYIRNKNEIFSILTKRKNKELVDTHEIDKAINDIHLGYMKCKLSLDLELNRHHLLNVEVADFDNKLKLKMVEYIIKATEQFKMINGKIEMAKKILLSRQNINKLITNYFINTKNVNLSRNELTALFDKDISNLDTILQTGTLISEDKNDHNKDIFEFKLLKNSSFKLSISELQANIDQQINECDVIEKRIQDIKATWKSSTLKLVEYLQQIETEIVV